MSLPLSPGIFATDISGDDSGRSGGGGVGGATRNASLGVSWLGELDGGTRAASFRTYRGRGGGYDLRRSKLVGIPFSRHPGDTASTLERYSVRFAQLAMGSSNPAFSLTATHHTESLVEYKLTNVEISSNALQ